jgi:hypothetical protein
VPRTRCAHPHEGPRRRVRVHTGQLFFDDGLTDQVYRSAPYSSRGTPDVRNSADDIFRSAGAASAVLAVTPSAQGYTGDITVGVKRS